MRLLWTTPYTPNPRMAPTTTPHSWAHCSHFNAQAMGAVQLKPPVATGGLKYHVIAPGASHAVRAATSTAPPSAKYTACFMSTPVATVSAVPCTWEVASCTARQGKTTSHVVAPVAGAAWRLRT